MIRRALIPVVVLLLLAVSFAQAESMRTVLTKENKMPSLHRPEVGVLFDYWEVNSENMLLENGTTFVTSPYLRFAVLENLTVFGQLPYQNDSPDIGDNTSGLGDVVVGFELLAFQDIFEYPWVMPHVSVSLPTGDENEGLGAGESVVNLGAAAGTTVMDIFHWAIDFRYKMQSDEENIASVAVSFIWDLSESFSLSVEGKATDEEYKINDKHPLYFIGGASYKAAENLSFMVYGGSGEQTDQDVFAGGKVALSF
jgi:hypothetical protein